MAKKTEKLRVIDQKTSSVGAPLPLIQEDQIAPPAFYVVPAPDTLILVGQAIQRSTQAPLVAVALSWQEAPNIGPDYYNVEWSEDSAFVIDVNRARAINTSATISGLKANGVTYYFRVQAVLGGIYSGYSETLAVVTMTDVTPAPEVTGLSAAFINGDLIISWVKPISEIFKDAEIKIYNAGHTILYATLYSANQQITWTAEQNLAATSQVGVTSVSIDVRSRSWGNTFSTGINTTAISTAPATPSGYVISWIGDIGLAAADLRATWLPTPNADSYDLSFDGVVYQTKDIAYTYSYERNVKDHVPTLASGDPNITVLIAARNKLNQVSVPVNVTVSNLAPPSSYLALSAITGFSQIAANVSILSGAIIQDFDHYEWALTSGAATLQQFNSSTPDVTILVSGSGNYSVTVKAVDKFNQKSTGVTVSNLVMDVLTISELRSETTYIDSLGASSPALDIFKDGLLTGSSKAYTAVASGTYQWIEARRPLLDRYKTVTLGVTYAGIALGYYEFNDGATVTYYSGPITVGAAGQKILTKYTVLATAKTNAIRLDLFSLTRYDLPNIQEARTIRVNFSNYGGTATVFEYYPRRLVQSDDIDAENVRSINIAAGNVTADKISVINLAAVSAQMGALHMDGVIDIVVGGGIYQGTGSFASPTTGLKIFNSGGVGKLSTYNTGVEQITLDTDGKFKAGAGAVLLDANGITVNARFVTPGYGAPTTTGIKWVLGGLTVATIEGLVVDDTPDWYTIDFKNTYQANSQTNISASFGVSIGSGNANASLYAGTGGAHGLLELNATTDIRMNGGDLTVGYTGGGDLKVAGNSILVDNVSIGSTIAATRKVSIFGDTQYIGWNNTAGTEKWVIGLETGNAGRFAIFSNAASTYGLYIDATTGYVTLPQGAQISRGVNNNGALAILGTAASSHFNYSTAEDTYIRGGKTTSNVIINDTGNSTVIDGNTSVVLQTNGVDRIGLGAAGNIALFGHSTFGGGVNVIGITNRTTAPTTNPTLGGLLYVEAGALKYRGSSGTVTNIANA